MPPNQMGTDEDRTVGEIPAWVVTFGDMMSLLLTFFIMLVSLSEIKDQQRYQSLVDSIKRQFGHESTLRSFVPGSSRPRNSLASKVASMGRSRKYDTHRGGDRAKAPVGDDPRVKTIRQGRRTSVGTVITFPEGTDDINDAEQDDLRVQAKVFRGKPQRIEIRGHTSWKPPMSPGDHWDLAYHRCRKVLQILVNQGIDPRRMRLSVAGPHEPAYLGADQEKVGLNPRVEVFLLDEQVSDSVGSTSKFEISRESPRED